MSSDSNIIDGGLFRAAKVSMHCKISMYGSSAQAQAPPPFIFKLPVEVFLLIAEMCSHDGLFETPWVLSSICRHFRRILLHTPSVWTALEVHPELPGPLQPHPELMRLWLARCKCVGSNNVQKVDISLGPWTPAATLAEVGANGSPIGALAFFDHYEVLLREFPNLEELRIGSSDYCHNLTLSREGNEWALKDNEGCGAIRMLQYSLLDQARFPNLTRLHLHSPHMFALQAIARCKRFPALQELCLHCDDTYWVKIVRNCAGTLVKLTLQFQEEYIDLNDTPDLGIINLPCLTHLSYLFVPAAESILRRLPQFVTPRLEQYIQEESYRDDFIHKDVSSVETFIVKGAFDGEWEPLSSVKWVKLHQSLGLIESNCFTLMANPHLCTKLDSMYGYSQDEESAEPFLHMLSAARYETNGQEICYKSRTDSLRLQFCYTYLDRKASSLHENHYKEDFCIDESWFEGLGDILDNRNFFQSFGIANQAYVDYDDYEYEGDMVW